MGFSFVVLIEIHQLHLCYKPFLSRGHEVKRPQNFFSKKVAQPLDTFDNVIYVTRITTGDLAVFVSASACNSSFGQGYAHQLIGEKAMKNPNTSANTNPVADENGNINCTNCENCKNCADCLNCKNCTDCTDCIDCKDCKHCKHCEDCKNCANCNNCDNCTDCYSCDYCANCNNCSGCTECESCKDCGDRGNNVIEMTKTK